MAWRSLGPVLLAAGSVLAAGCSPADDTVQRDVRSDVDGRTDGVIDFGDDGGGGDAPFSCVPGRWDCWGTLRYRCGDDGLSRLDETTCELACDPALGCVLCRPGTRRCEGNVSMVCSPEGDAWFTGRDCTEWGAECNATGTCNDACGEAEATRSYVTSNMSRPCEVAAVRAGVSDKGSMPGPLPAPNVFGRLGLITAVLDSGTYTLIRDGFATHSGPNTIGIIVTRP